MLYSNRHLILEHIAAQRLPAIYQFPEIAEDSGDFPPLALNGHPELIKRRALILRTLLCHNE